MVSLEIILFAIFNTNLIAGWNFPEEVVPEKTKIGFIPEAAPSAYDNYVDEIISNGIANLTLSINRVLCSDNSNKNIIFSPISIAGALALILLGATGSTENEIAHVLGIISGTDIYNKTLVFHEHAGNLFNKLHRSKPETFTLNFANGIFIQEDFKVREAYKQISKILYKSEIVNLDFKSDSLEAQNIINNWVSKKTNSKIKTILDDTPSGSTKLIIANALYFKGQWELPFNPKTTNRRPFYLNGRQNKEKVVVDMMANSEYYPYYKDLSLNCEIIGFPYKDANTTMYVVMPVNSNIQTLKDLENSLTPSKLSNMINKMSFTDAVVLFPKMHLDSFIDLKSTFHNLGMHSLFNPSDANLALLAEGGDVSLAPIQNKLYETSDENPNAPFIFSSRSQNFEPSTNNKSFRRNNRSDTFEYLRQLTSTNNRILKNPGLYADKIVHKTYMDISETGTEAAAVTSISAFRVASKLTFRVDAPFLFFIRDEATKVILFWGTIYKPTPFF